MRGHPNSTATCSSCGSPNGLPNCKQCRTCINISGAKWKYRFTADHDERLRQIYAEHASNRRRLTKALTALQNLIGFPRHIIRLRAQKLGITVDIRRPWSQQEIGILREYSGRKSITAIARMLHRARTTVTAMMGKLKISQKVTEGYTRQEAAYVLGVSNLTMERWVASRLLRVSKATNRITEASIEQFVRAHPEKYSLKRVDEVWFKGLMFPRTFGMSVVKRAVSAPVRDSEERMEA